MGQYGMSNYGYRPIEWSPTTSSHLQKRRTSLANHIDYINGWKYQAWSASSVI